MPNIERSEKEWKEKLNEEQYMVMREHGTEDPFTGKFLGAEGEGVFHCVGCETALFDMQEKFDLGSGWLSFKSPVSDDVLKKSEDTSDHQIRTAIACSHCGSHLGHFYEEEGPHEGEDRYAVFSCCLTFKGELKLPESLPEITKEMIQEKKQQNFKVRAKEREKEKTKEKNKPKKKRNKRKRKRRR